MIEKGGLEAKFLASLGSSMPLKRLGEMKDIAAAVAFLASDEAGHITS